MPNYTTHLNLAKPLPNESADITVINANMDAIDDAIGTGLVADNITFTDSANLFNATTVEGALNELFINADNGKKAIAGVVGQPLNNSDSFVQMQSKIQVLKDTLAINLVNNSIQADGSEDLRALVNKVSNIDISLKTYSIEYTPNLPTGSGTSQFPPFSVPGTPVIATVSGSYQFTTGPIVTYVTCPLLNMQSPITFTQSGDINPNVSVANRDTAIAKVLYY